MWKILPIIFLFAACSFGPGNFQSRQSNDLEQRRIKRIAVLPPMAPSVEEKPRVPYTAPPVPGEKPDNSQREAPEVLAKLLYSTMAGLPAWQIVSDREVREVLPSVPRGAEGVRAKKLGEIVYADAVLSGRIIRYRERVGEQWGAKSPASVTFVLELWDVKRGDIVWSARFDETQKPLSENLFALGEVTQRGVKWLSAEELAHEGVKKAVHRLHRALYRRQT